MSPKKCSCTSGWQVSPNKQRLCRQVCTLQYVHRKPLICLPLLSQCAECWGPEGRPQWSSRGCSLSTRDVWGEGQRAGARAFRVKRGHCPSEVEMETNLTGSHQYFTEAAKGRQKDESWKWCVRKNSRFLDVDTAAKINKCSCVRAHTHPARLTRGHSSSAMCSEKEPSLPQTAF